MKAMSELFKLPLKAQRRCANPHWGMTIVEQGNDDGDMAWSWIMEVNARTERTNGSRTLLVSAQERAEAIVAAVNERDVLCAEVKRLRGAASGVVENSCLDVTENGYSVLWEDMKALRAALDAGQGGKE